MADDDATVVDTEITPDIFDGEQETPKAESTPAQPEAKAEEAKEEPEVAKEEAKAEPEETETETPEETPKEEETDTEPLSDKPLTPKSQGRFQKLANENRELREKIDKLTSETYAPQTVEELAETVNPDTGDVYTVAQAAELALQQQLQMRDYKDRVVHAQTVVGTEAWEVLNELPVFNPDREEYDSELSAIAAETLEANLVRDPNMPEVGPDGKPTGLGTIIDFKQSPKQIYQTLARISDTSRVKGQLKGQQDTEKMLANADAGGSAAPPKTKVDPLTVLWDEPL